MLSRCNNILLSEHIQIYTASRILSLRRWASNIVKSRNWQFSTNSMDGVNRIAIGQMRSTNDKEHNRRQVKEIVERGAAAKACVSLLNALVVNPTNVFFYYKYISWFLFDFSLSSCQNAVTSWVMITKRPYHWQSHWMGRPLSSIKNSLKNTKSGYLWEVFMRVFQTR